MTSLCTMRGIRLVSFDATNTLIRFKLPLGVSYQQACQQHGVVLDTDQLPSHFKTQYKNMWNRFPNFGHDTIGCRKWWSVVVSGTLHSSGFNPTSKAGKEQLMEQIFSDLYESFSTNELWTLDPNALEVLEELKKSGRKLIIISNTDDRLENILKSLGVRQYFDVVINSYEAGVFKPHKGIFDLALSLAYPTSRKLSAQQAVHIGDNFELDFNGARTAGWHGLLLDRENKQTEIRKELQLRSLREVPTKLRTLGCHYECC